MRLLAIGVLLVALLHPARPEDGPSSDSTAAVLSTGKCLCHSTKPEKGNRKESALKGRKTNDNANLTKAYNEQKKPSSPKEPSPSNQNGRLYTKLHLIGPYRRQPRDEGSQKQDPKVPEPVGELPRVHSRRRRSVQPVEFHYVSQPQVPRFKYIKIIQKIPIPEPEPVPEPAPLPVVQKTQHVIEEESHSKHESEEHEHEEEHELHESVHHEEEYEAAEAIRLKKLAVQQQNVADSQSQSTRRLSKSEISEHHDEEESYESSIHSQRVRKQNSLRNHNLAEESRIIHDYQSGPPMHKLGPHPPPYNPFALPPSLRHRLDLNPQLLHKMSILHPELFQRIPLHPGLPYPFAPFPLMPQPLGLGGIPIAIPSLHHRLVSHHSPLGRPFPSPYQRYPGGLRPTILSAAPAPLLLPQPAVLFPPPPQFISHPLSPLRRGPHTYTDKLGLLHTSLETSGFESLDLIQLGSNRLGQPVWRVDVDDRQGRYVSFINIGREPGNLNFFQESGVDGHQDWVYRATDEAGLPHDLHFKNSRGHLELVRAVHCGQDVDGLLGYDEAGEVLVPVHFEKGHLVVEDMVYTKNFIIN